MILELLLPLLAEAATPQPDVSPAEDVETTASSNASAGIGDPKESAESTMEDILVEGEAPKPEPMRCRSEKVIGSGIKKKICRTESQIKAEAAGARNAANNMSQEMRTRSAAGWNETR